MESKIAHYRKNKGMTQQELADLSDVKLRSLQRYESGERDVNKAHAILIYKIANALGVEVEDILNLE